MKVIRPFDPTIAKALMSEGLIYEHFRAESEI